MRRLHRLGTLLETDERAEYFRHPRKSDPVFVVILFHRPPSSVSLLSQFLVCTEDSTESVCIQVPLLTLVRLPSPIVKGSYLTGSQCLAGKTPKKFETPISS